MVYKAISRDEDTRLFTQLKGINFLLKNFQTEAAIEQLKTYERGVMSPGIQMFFIYLQAKVSIYHFEQSFSLAHLIQADEYMTELIRVGHESKVSPRCPNYLYTRAIVKYKLFIEHGDADARIQYRSHALRLVEFGMKRFEALDCFAMLHTELMKGDTL